MRASLFEARAGKRTVSLTNAPRVAEEALAQALRNKRNEVLNQEIRQDREALAKYVAEHGDPAAELREMFEQSPDAA